MVRSTDALPQPNFRRTEIAPETMTEPSLATTIPFPFTAIVGQEDLKLAILLAVVDPSIGGVLVTGHRGTAKSTAVRALAQLLPPMQAIAGCPYHCDPEAPAAACPHCARGGARRPERQPVPVVDLPLGATEDRVVGSVDLERALVDEYAQAMASAMQGLSPANAEHVSQLAALPDVVRGYGEVKLANVAKFRAQLAALLSALSGRAGRSEVSP